MEDAQVVEVARQAELVLRAVYAQWQAMKDPTEVLPDGGLGAGAWCREGIAAQCRLEGVGAPTEAMAWEYFCRASAEGCVGPDVWDAPLDRLEVALEQWIGRFPHFGLRVITAGCWSAAAYLRMRYEQRWRLAAESGAKPDQGEAGDGPARRQSPGLAERHAPAAVALPTEPEIAWCVKEYRIRGRRNGWLWNRRRELDNRSFPTGYPVPPPDAELTQMELAERELALMRELGRVSRDSRVRGAVAADRRVFMGPSDEDAAALPHVGDAWCLAEHACTLAGVRTRTGYNPHVRYGVLLDFATRDFGQRLARRRDGIAKQGAYRIYGFDPLRIAVDHNAPLDDVRVLAARAGLRSAA